MSWYSYPCIVMTANVLPCLCCPPPSHSCQCVAMHIASCVVLLSYYYLFPTGLKLSNYTLKNVITKRNSGVLLPPEFLGLHGACVGRKIDGSCSRHNTNRVPKKEKGIQQETQASGLLSTEFLGLPTHMRVPILFAGFSFLSWKIQKKREKKY